jgi:hypothetical protein
MGIRHKVFVRYAKACLHSLKTIYNYRELNFNKGDILVDVEFFNGINHFKLSSLTYAGSPQLAFSLFLHIYIAFAAFISSMSLILFLQFWSGIYYISKTIFCILMYNII